jgi:hypothetical protein
LTSLIQLLHPIENAGNKMTIFYILLVIVFCSTLLTLVQFRTTQRKELNDLLELFEDTTTNK